MYKCTLQCDRMTAILVAFYLSLLLAYCITIWKLQGFMLSKAILSLIEGYYNEAEVVFKYLFIRLSKVWYSKDI